MGSKWYKQSLYREMILKMAVFLILPFLLSTSFLFSRLLRDSARGYQDSIALLTEQGENARETSITEVLQVANRITSSNELKGFLLSRYNYRSWSYYAEEIARMVSGGLSYENTIIPKLYLSNDTIPRGFRIFYSLRDIAGYDMISDFLASPETERWITPEMVQDYPSATPFTPFMAHYTYLRKVYSDEGLLYLLTLSVSADTMDSVFYQEYRGSSINAPEIIQTPETLIVNYSGKELDTAAADFLQGRRYTELSFDRLRFPQKLLYVWGRNSQPGYYLLAFLLLLTFSVFSIVINLRFVRRLFDLIASCIDKFGTSVKTGSYEILPVTDGREIGQIIRTFNALVEEIQDLMQRTARQTALAKESQLKALQHQINPHFLYNTLEVFSYRMERYGHAEEADAIASFSRLLRYNLAREGRYATLAEELRQVRGYIRIQMLKYPDVRFEAEIPDHLQGLKVIRFLLQPLVENCFQHGYGGNPLHIRICAREEGDMIRFEIWDNGNGMTAERLEAVRRTLQVDEDTPQEGIGLNNINRRLLLFYSEGSRLQIDSEAGRWTRVTFRIPGQPKT